MVLAYRAKAQQLWTVPSSIGSSATLAACELRAARDELNGGAVAPGTKANYTRVWAEVYRFVEIDLALQWQLPLSVNTVFVCY